jgi:hypothetical protein
VWKKKGKKKIIISGERRRRWKVSVREWVWKYGMSEPNNNK